MGWWLACSALRLHMMASMRSWSPKTELRDVPAWDRGVGTAAEGARNSKGSRSCCFRHAELLRGFAPVE